MKPVVLTYLRKKMLKNSKEAKYILDENAKKFVSNSSLPVQIENICNHIGLKIRKVASAADDVTFVKTIGGLEIRFPEAHNLDFTLSARQRFLLAHELGHFVLSTKTSVFPTTKSEYWQIELLADSFARSILLPQTVMSNYLKNCDNSPSSIFFLSKKIASLAGVPWQVVAHRIAELLGNYAFFNIAKVQKGDGIYNINMSTLPNKILQNKLLKCNEPLLPLVDYFEKIIKINEGISIPKDVILQSFDSNKDIFEKCIDGYVFRQYRNTIRLVVRFAQ